MCGKILQSLHSSYTRLFIAYINTMYIHNNKYQTKYSEFVKHSEARKELEENIYTE